MNSKQAEFENQFIEIDDQWVTLAERMRHYRIPGASIGYVGGNELLWSAGYGYLEAGITARVQTDTPFQAASLSKPHAAIGVQRLFEMTGLALDSPVIRHTSWAIPCRTCGATINWSGNVTVKETLQHKGGFIGRGNTCPLDKCSNFTAGGGGFDGYPVGQQLPTLDQILAGTHPANSPPIELTTMPGEGADAFHYSGMGYVVMMRMVQDMTGQEFLDWAEANVLQPMGMTASTFRIDLPPSLPLAAAGHDTDGEPIPGLRNRYPESAAAGLYTNAGDLCRTIIMLNCSGVVGGTRILSDGQATAMLRQQIGIFTANDPGEKDYLFNHSGENYGFTTFMQGFPNQGAGMAIMLNIDNENGIGSDFYSEAVNALVRVYGLVS